MTMKVLSALAFALPLAWADNTSTSFVNIHIPEELNKKGGYDHRGALFGVPPYGSSIFHNLYYADADLCSFNLDDSKGGYPTRPIGNDGQMVPWPVSFILMVDRGGCTFVTKVRNAQRFGAAAVIIADNSCLCSDLSCVDASEKECEKQEPILADDGSGSDITIPTVMMFKQDADAIKAALKQNQLVQVEMSWTVPAPDDRVEYDIYTTPTDVVSSDFRKSFGSIAAALGNKAYFTPHMYIYDGVQAGCEHVDGNNPCYNLCTNRGRYCATDPDNDLDHGISGADVVRESLRRMCIWKAYGEVDGLGLQWWNYVQYFEITCQSDDLFTAQDCIEQAYRYSKVDPTMIDQCMADSGGFDSESNTMLDAALQQTRDAGIVVVPTVTVNNIPLRGALSKQNIFDAICAGFAAGSAPDVCSKCSGSSNLPECVGPVAVGPPADVLDPVQEDNEPSAGDESLVDPSVPNEMAPSDELQPSDPTPPQEGPNGGKKKKNKGMKKNKSGKKKGKKGKNKGKKKGKKGLRGKVSDETDAESAATAGLGSAGAVGDPSTQTSAATNTFGAEPVESHFADSHFADSAPSSSSFASGSGAGMTEDAAGDDGLTISNGMRAGVLFFVGALQLAESYSVDSSDGERNRLAM